MSETVIQTDGGTTVSPRAVRMKAVEVAVTWWCDRSDAEKVALGILGGVAFCAVSGALVYAIATGGVVIATGETLVLVGNAAPLILALA